MWRGEELRMYGEKKGKRISSSNAGANYRHSRAIHEFYYRMTGPRPNVRRYITLFRASPVWQPVVCYCCSKRLSSLPTLERSASQNIRNRRQPTEKIHHIAHLLILHIMQPIEKPDNPHDVRVTIRRPLTIIPRRARIFILSSNPH